MFHKRILLSALVLSLLFQGAALAGDQASSSVFPTQVALARQAVESSAGNRYYARGISAGIGASVGLGMSLAVMSEIRAAAPFMLLYPPARASHWSLLPVYMARYPWALPAIGIIGGGLIGWQYGPSLVRTSKSAGKKVWGLKRHLDF